VHPSGKLPAVKAAQAGGATTWGGAEGHMDERSGSRGAVLQPPLRPAGRHTL